ncbi:MAG TPA: phosphotransferase [Gemmataceae bacterium]|nr:phosphotransferase [Gemmataceae bacterium]
MVSAFPDLRTLSAGLTSVLSGNGPVTVLDRAPNHYLSSYASEIVTCRCGTEELRLFCKYSDGGHGASGHGHWGGLDYEAEVYRQVLSPAAVATPRFYGTYTDAKTGFLWLFLQYLEESLRISKSPERMPHAARWLGQFHADQERRLARAPLAWLRCYDAASYAGWAQRTLEFAGPLRDRFPWLRPLCGRFMESLTGLLAAPQTVVHGEFYPQNVLCQDGKVYPVDWESAAIAAGEVDVACLTDDWGPEIARLCEREYEQTRWPAGAPARWRETIALARVYVHLRWLGDLPDLAVEESGWWRFDELRAAGEQAGLI